MYVKVKELFLFVEQEYLKYPQIDSQNIRDRNNLVELQVVLPSARGVVGAHLHCTAHLTPCPNNASAYHHIIRYCNFRDVILLYHKPLDIIITNLLTTLVNRPDVISALASLVGSFPPKDVSGKFIKKHSQALRSRSRHQALGPRSSQVPHSAGVLR
jgi:hypothetical protein